MGIKYKDYYQVLGLSRGATDDLVRQAYRNLARKYHPDFNLGDRRCEDKFKEINEAYEVLGDSEKRRQYDQIGPAWNGRKTSQPPPGGSRHSARPGNAVSGPLRSGFSDFFEALFGGGKTPREARSPGNRRDGKSKSGDIEAEAVISLENAHLGGVHKIVIQTKRPCPTCKGRSSAAETVCAACGGSGQVTNGRPVDVKIPPGAREGSIIKLPGLGLTAQRAGVAGDLLVKLKIEPHAIFSVIGDDVHAEASISPSEAVLGANIQIPTLNGKAEIRVAPNTQGGTRLRVKGQGLNRRDGKRGDAYVKLNIVVPANPTEREKSLYRELAEAASFDPRKPRP
jgi:DnaJ-class molecular chaperone